MAVLIIDPFSSGTDYPPLLTEAGITPYIVQTDESVTSGLAQDKNSAYLQHTEDFHHNLDSLYAWALDHDIRSVLTGAESGVPIAEALKEALKTHTAPSALEQEFLSRRYNKYSMLQAAHNAGVEVGKFLHITDTTALSEAEYGAQFHPEEAVVIKPCISAGSVDVTVVDNYAEAKTTITELLSKKNLFGYSGIPVLVQEFHRGVEFIVDIVSFNGTHHTVAVSNYDKHRNSSGHFIYDRITWLPSSHEAYDEVVAYAHKILDAIGYSDGAAHIEIMLTESGPFLIDIGLRPHGAGHPQRTYELTGNSQIHQEIDNALIREGLKTEYTRDYALHSFGSIEFFSLDSAAKTREILDFQGIHALPQVRDFISNLEVNKDYPATRTLLDSLSLGMCFIVGESPDEVQYIAEEVRTLFSRSFIQ